MSSKYEWGKVSEQIGDGKLSKQTRDNNICLLQQNFPEIEKEIILQAWNYCDEDIDETNEILHYVNDNRLIIKSTCLIFFFLKYINFVLSINSIFHDDQKLLLSLLVDFGNQVNKTEILNIWKQCNRIFYETRFKLEEICSSRDTNRVLNIINDRPKEREELMIVRSMSLYILWNILNHSRTIKYRQISSQSLYKNLKLKCDQLGANFVETLNDMKGILLDFGFKKINDEDWYYRQDIQILHLWNRYRKWVNAQL
ncbi:hypothetical protein RFI_35739, partial [Reticulomyxa filosa]